MPEAGEIGLARLRPTRVTADFRAARFVCALLTPPPSPSPPPSRHAIRSSFSAASRAGAVWIEPAGGWKARLQPPWSPASSVCVGWQVSAAAFDLKRSAGSSVENGAQVGSRADPGTPPPLPFRGSHAIAAPPPLPRPLSHTLRLDEPAKQGGTSRCCSDSGMVWGGAVLAAVAARPSRRSPTVRIAPTVFMRSGCVVRPVPSRARRVSHCGGLLGPQTRCCCPAANSFSPPREGTNPIALRPFRTALLQASLVRSQPPFRMTRRWVAGGLLGGRAGALGDLRADPPSPPSTLRSVAFVPRPYRELGFTLLFW